MKKDVKMKEINNRLEFLNNVKKLNTEIIKEEGYFMIKMKGELIGLAHTKRELFMFLIGMIYG